MMDIKRIIKLKYNFLRRYSCEFVVVFVFIPKIFLPLAYLYTRESYENNHI
jgi:hypothetical protein